MKTSVLVIKLGALGDIILATESFQSIRAHHPGANITLLTRRPFVGLAQLMPWFDQVWPDPAPKPWQLNTVIGFRRQLRAPRFSRIYDLQGNDRARFYQRLGRWSADIWVTAAMTEKTVRRLGLPPMPVAQRHRELLAQAGVPSIGPADLSWLDAPLDEFNLPQKIFLLIPGCSPKRLEKRWPPEHYIELAKQVVRQGLTPVVIGTAADEPAPAIVSAGVPEAINLSGRTTIPQVAALARRAQGVVGNDTGPIHLAGAVGAPTLVLMSGASDPVRVKPIGPVVSYLQVENLAELAVAQVQTELRRWVEK